MNIVTVYLFRFLDEKVYIHQSTLMKDDTSRVCLLKKALYSLKQSAHVWYQTLQNFLKKLSFKCINSDQELFIFNDKFIYIAIYVDDILFFTASDNSQVLKVMQELWDCFQMTDLDEVLHYLDIKVNNDIENKISKLHQSTYLKKVLDRYDIKDITLTKISMFSEILNSLNSNSNQASKKTIMWYELAVEALMWLAMHFRSDLAQSVTVMTHFCSNLRFTHVTLIKQVFQYIADIINKGLVFRGNDTSDDIEDYTDSDFTDVRMSHKSISSWKFNLVNTAISHSFKL